MRCPRCGTDEVVAGRYKKVPLARCATCGGVLVEIRHNVAFLDALAKDLAAHVDLDTEIAPFPGEARPAACPRCGQAMARFGYLGTNRVFLDRCSPCMALWHDGDELGTTAALHARTTRRSEERVRARAQAIDEQNRRFHVMTLAREAMDDGFGMT